jgi:vacuolar-type H+-ATPase subunit I/STV1
VRFEIRKDPRLKTSVDDFQAQFDLHSKINVKLSEVHKAIKRLREVRSTVNGLSSRWKDLDTNRTKDVNELSKTITDSLTSIEDNLIQTKAKAFQDLLNYPVKLNNKIASLGSVASSADRRPTQQTYDLFATLGSRADEYLAALRSIELKEITDLNTRIKGLDLPAVPAPSKSK